MIYPASTFLLATLVVNAASVLGAPIRIPASSQPIARALDDPVLVERTKIEKVAPVARSVDLDPAEARSIHQRETVPEIATRNTAPSVEVEARDPLPEIEEIVRRYPRRELYVRHETPSSPPEARSPSPDPESSPPTVVRRFFRRELYERHQPRAEPAPPVEAREPTPAPPVLQARKFPRQILAEWYSAEKRSPTPPADEPVVARAPEPEPQPKPEPVAAPNRMIRRYARRGMAEQVEAMEARQVPDPATPPPANVPPVDPNASSSVPPSAATPTASSSSASPSATLPVLGTEPNPVVDIINGPNKAGNFVGGALPTNGLPMTIDREHETTVYHKKTSEHINQCGSPVGSTTPVTPGSPPVPPVPIPSSTTSTGPLVPPVPVPSGQTGTGTNPVVPPVQPGTPVQPVPGQQGAVPPPPTDGTTTVPPPATPSGDATNAPIVPPVVPASGTDPALSPATPVDGTQQPPPQVRRDGADGTILRGRSLGYSGPAYASYIKRSMT